MNRRELFAGVGAVAFVTAFAGQAQAVVPVTPSLPSSHSEGREVLSLNKGWRFHDGDIPFPTIMGHGWTYNAAKAGSAQGAAATGYDDSEWGAVTLPHDFVSSQPIVEDANVSQGYRKRGIVWYRNVLKFDKSDDGKHIELQMDGIATNATIWFNGTLVCRNWSGYNSAYIDLTPYATYGEMLNSLVVRVDANAMEGWWYEGGGIYRDAWIIKRNPVHIITDGVFAHPVKTDTGWKIPVEVTLYNIETAGHKVEVVCDLLDADGKVVIVSLPNLFFYL